MKRLLLLAALVVSGAANAADLPYKAPPPPPPLLTWTGFYVGAQAGYGWTQIPPPQVTDPVSPPQPDGGFWGGQIGANYQLAQRWVIGAELDAAWARLENTFIGRDPAFPGTLLADTIRVQALASARGRFGMVVLDRALVYATGGAAWGRFDLVTSSSNSSPGPGNPQVGNSQRTLHGWTAGAGIEAALWSNWTGRIEYLFYHFDPASFIDFHPAASPPLGADLHTVRVGVNWMFH
jgi:outer membrane immunogenic protein